MDRQIEVQMEGGVRRGEGQISFVGSRRKDL
jgi:hypothetical protein